jgi:hypothetical protein
MKGVLLAVCLTGVISCTAGTPPGSDAVDEPEGASVSDLYRFVAAHGAIMRALPCVCGCDSLGHKSAEDCFVKRRGILNSVVEWEPHGAT